MTPNNPKMRPTTLVRRVNQAGFGTVLSERRLKTHRQSDINSADGKSVDLLKYAAWLTFQFFRDDDKRQDYNERKRKQAEKNADEVRAAQDIGPLPDVVDPQRKKAALKSFRVFCETYFGEVFYLPWSEDHLRVIKKIERSVTKGGLFAMAMPRGSGKTVLCQTAVAWAALSGATPFVCLVAASAERGKDLLENIKTWLETNELLQQDFPKVCFPIQCLERIANRQKGQKYLGEPTRIEWGADRIILPTIKGSLASGVVISCSGMKGSDIRGQNYARPDGKVVRPKLVLIDDPQTTESAWSATQGRCIPEAFGLNNPRVVASLICYRFMVYRKISASNTSGLPATVRQHQPRSNGLPLVARRTDKARLCLPDERKTLGTVRRPSV